MRKRNIILNNHALPLVEYQGQRAVTFAMIDRVHERPEGTAAATFRRHRQRFITGRHFYELTADEIRRQSLTHLFPARTAKGLLIAEAGYLLLVKPFHDNLSWKIQEILIAAYFRTVPEFPELHHVAVPDMATLAGMPVQEAQHIVTRAESESFREHGQRGSQSMTLRRREKRALRPVLLQVQAWSQPPLTGFDAACGPEGDA
ncbi:hypothetical protein M942_09350 [Enterobacter ludwigii]|jgi:hypothetical protein|uniref:ORF6N domain-containing protein n=1 Tax=Enterobacter TaxID=547 RepID=UPI0003D8FA8B|nr:ORF6N domain-containing protein [Enterobacter ludwigii]AHE72823.1 hypothetical protein M942_09350 [Enterobacter ludwigii]HDR2587501.1 ORF6N domain-containing protein [Enterobacter ludwigii]HDR2598945.1 ORF6N domain-containing protein [Enterobacter ludwigii]